MARGVRALVAAIVLTIASDAARGVPDEPAAFVARRAAADDDVKAALDWLARHQIRAPKAAEDGAWSLSGFGKRCVAPRCDGPGIDCAGGVAPTALALCAFLGAGETPVAGDHREAVDAALRYVLASQDADGCFGPRSIDAFLVGHAAATGAVAQTYWATHDPALLPRLTKARDFLLRAQIPGSGWRYGVAPAGDADTFLTATACVALRDAELAGLDVSRASKDGALAWLDLATDAAGRAGYAARGGFDARVESVVLDQSSEDAPRIRGFRTAAALPGADGNPANIPAATLRRFPVDRGSSMTAAAALVRALFGGDAALVDAGARLVLAAPPRLPGAPRFVDFHYALFGSLLLAQRGGGAEWRTACVDALRALRRPAKDGCAAGSFDPDADPWGAIGGRVYATATAALALEAPTRFPKAKKAGKK